MTLQNLLLERLASGLKRSAITKPSKWAETYRVMGGSHPGKWSFKYYPWLRDMHDSEAQTNVGQKAAQMGFTEMALNLVFYYIDIKSLDCLYILPAKTPDASDFSAARFDAALDLSPHLSQMFSDVKNVGHKRAGDANLYIRGSQSRAGLKSIPVSVIVMDELEEMNQENIALAIERTSGQFEKKIWQISTPRFENMGINREFLLSTQEHFCFKCPSCNRQTELIYPDCLKIIGETLTDPRIKETYLVCKDCKATLPHKTKWQWLSTGKWVPMQLQRENRGFAISQLYSSTVQPYEIAQSYFRSLTNPHDEQELHNSKLGTCHIVAGARITDTMLEKCKASHHNDAQPVQGIITLGADVGPKWIHVEIDQWFILPGNVMDANLQAKCKVIHQCRVPTFQDLENLILQYGVTFIVIDAQPEYRNSILLCKRFHGRSKACFYGRGINNRMIHCNPDTSEPTITVDRTAWLDLSLGRFKTGMISIPYDIDLEYREHLKALIRAYGKDKNDNPVGSYVKGENDPDHFAHARNYAEIALPFALGLGQSQDMQGVL